MIETVVISVLIALALSVDAFIACFAYGANQKCTNLIMKTPIIIGVFHFVFPLLTFYLFHSIEAIQPIGKIISAVIFLFLGIVCFIDKKETQKPVFNIVGILLLAFSVSIDSLLIGVSLAYETNNILLPAIIFGFITALISFIALKFGSFLACRIKYNLDFIAGIFFIILAIFTFIEAF